MLDMGELELLDEVVIVYILLELDDVDDMLEVIDAEELLVLLQVMVEIEKII